MSRHVRLLVLAGSVVAASAVPAPALERTAVRLDVEEHDSWSRSTTGTIRYYNSCTGWVWVWSVPGERLGEVFQSTGASGLTTSWTLTYYGTRYCGYGYVGTIAVHDVDADDCPVEPPLAKQPFCIPALAGWQATTWNGLSVPSRFAIVITNPYTGTLASDHPAAGATGPISCGTCFPMTRTTHSYSWGPLSAPFCPGEKLFDGFCDAELMIDVNVTTPTAVEGKSWGQIKGLYR